jgi:hypothetical protein
LQQKCLGCAGVRTNSRRVTSEIIAIDRGGLEVE